MVFPHTRPRRLRKNLEFPPCNSYENCKSLHDFYLYREWVAKEWAIYAQEILLVRDDWIMCVKKDRIQDPDRVCGPLFMHYLQISDRKNIQMAKRRLEEGKKIMGDNGYVYKYSETKEGFEEALKYFYTRSRLRQTPEAEVERFEQSKRYPYQ